MTAETGVGDGQDWWTSGIGTQEAAVRSSCIHSSSIRILIRRRLGFPSRRYPDFTTISVNVQLGAVCLEIHSHANIEYHTNPENRKVTVMSRSTIYLTNSFTLAGRQTLPLSNRKCSVRKMEHVCLLMEKV